MDIGESYKKSAMAAETRALNIPQIDWQSVRIQATIAAMPIADKIVDNLYGANYHNKEKQMHTIDSFVKQCVGIADARIEELKKEK